MLFPCRVLKQVKIVHVLAPATPSVQSPVKVSPSPVKISVITTPNKLAGASSPTKALTSLPSSSPSSSPLHIEDPLKGLTNGLSHRPDQTADAKKPISLKEQRPKTPVTPKFPLSPEVYLDPANYRYEVEYMDGSSPNLTVKASVLSRPKGVLSPKKLKIFLRNAMCRPSEKHPLTVKASG